MTDEELARLDQEINWQQAARDSVWDAHMKAMDDIDRRLIARLKENRRKHLRRYRFVLIGLFVVYTAADVVGWSAGFLGWTEIFWFIGYCAVLYGTWSLSKWKTQRDITQEIADVLVKRAKYIKRWGPPGPM